MIKSLLFIPIFFIHSVVFAQSVWTMDNVHSNIRFEAGWEEFSVRTGEFKVFEGTFEAKDGMKDLSDARFFLKVDPKSIDVIAEKLSETLRGERFLESDTFPEITFKTTSITKTGDQLYAAKGKLYLHGIEREEEAIIQVTGTNSATGKHTLGTKVTLTINRKDYKLDWGGDRLADKVDLIGYFLYRTKITPQ